MNNNYQHCIFITGQDYPIKSIDEIIKYLEKNKNKEFIDYSKIGKNDWNIGNRYTEYHTNNKYFDYILRKILPKRKFINNMVPYGGSSWFIFTEPAIDYIIKIYKNENIYKKLKYTICMDEIIFQSILLNSKFKDNVINDNMRYIDWSDHISGKNNGNPNILTKKDFKKITKSNKLFARKFDATVDEEILDILDQKLNKKN